jgi:hypothetical protein
LQFCPEQSRRQREGHAAKLERWKAEFEAENADGRVDRAREEFLRKLRALAQKTTM